MRDRAGRLGLETPAASRVAGDPFDVRAPSVIAWDLDHTLAVYDDDAVDALACDEAWSILRAEGTVPASASAPEWRADAVVRGLFIDVAGRRLVKPSARGAALRHDAPGSVVPGDGRVARVAHPVGSPFDRVTAVLWRAALAYAHPAPRALLGRVRRALDAAHTRGRLKQRILRDPGRFLLPPHPAWTRPRRPDAPREIVLTNSGRDYAVALLDHLLGRGAWTHRFDAIVCDARKGAFFSRTAAAPPRQERTEGTCAVVEGGGAAWVEARFGATPDRIAIVGDHPLHDLVAARERGWRTVAVLPELEDPGEGPWGHPLREGAERTWLGAVAARSDAVVERASRIAECVAADADDVA